MLYLCIRISLQSNTVQVFLSQRVAGVLSEKLKTRVSVSGVDIELFRTIVIHGLFVEDQRQDTLIHVGFLKGELGDIDFSANRYALTKIVLQDAMFYLKCYKGDSALNLQFIIDAFSGEDTSSSATTINLSCRNFVLENARFSYDEFNVPPGEFGFDYNHIGISEINAGITGVTISGDTISGEIGNLSAKEKSGLVLKNFTARAVVSPVFIALNDFKVITASSEAAGDLIFSYNEYPDFYDFLNKVKISSHLTRVELNASDIAFFAPPLKGIDKKIIFSGDIRGRISRIKGKNMKIQFGPNSFLRGEIALDGLPNMDETFISLNILDLETNRKDLELIPLPPFDSGGFLSVPENLASLGKINFSGNFTGFINDFVALGRLESALGELKSDIKLSTDTVTDRISYEGKLATTGFNIGKLIAQDTLLGIIAGSFRLKGSGIKKETLHMNMSGNITALDFKKYRYQDIKVEGEISKGKFNGLLAVKDKNIDLDFNGNIDFEPELPVFNFETKFQNVNLYAINLLKRDSVTSLSSTAQINFSGNSIDNIQGSVFFGNTFYREGKNSFEIDSLKLVAAKLDNEKVLTLESDFASGQLKGNFLAAELAPSFNHILSQILPSYFSKKIEKPKTIQQFTYHIKIHRTEKITRIFLPDLFMNTILIEGKYNSDEKEVGLDVVAPSIKYKKNALTDFSLNIKASDDILTINSHSQQFAFSDSMWIENVDLVFKLTNDQVQFGYSWKNNPGADDLSFNGSINGLATIYRNNKFSIRFLSSEIVLADSTWKFGDENEIFIDSSSIDFRNFVLKNNDQILAVNGKISENSEEALHVLLGNFNLENLNIVTEPAGITLGGIIHGTAVVSNPYHDILFNSNINFTGLMFNNELLGKGEFVSVYNTKAASIGIDGFFGREDSKTIFLNGFYFPERKNNELDLTASVNDLNLSMFSPYTVDIVSKLKGSATGKISIKGNSEAPELTGRIKVKKGSFFFDYLNTQYTLDTLRDVEVVIEKNWFGFDNAVVYDAKGNRATATGTIVHDNFKNFNLDISVDAHKFQALNTNAMLNSLYYGKAYMTGLVNIYGTTDNLVIDVEGKTEKGTEFFIPLSGPEEVSEKDFIKFVVKDSSAIKSQKDYQVNLSGIQLNFKLEVTPDSRIELIFDETAGDIMKARGAGNLMLEINTLGNFNMYGEFVVSEGDYLFTLENIINKKFIVKSGGTITWNGDPYDALLDLDAVYKLRAPLSDITGDTTMTKRVPVECHMLMTNKLMNPAIKFDIQLPSVDENVRNIIQTKINTEQDMNKQIFSLLIMNRFFPEQGGVSTGGSLAGSSASELLSNQLSNWLSQTTDIVNMGVNYRSASDVTTQEVELALSKQLFNDRVSIEGNVGVGGTSTTGTSTQNNNLVGDVNLEYKISNDGRFRAKMFNESNDYNLANATQSPYTQGVGVFYREEFNTFSQFFDNLLRRNKKTEKQESPQKSGE